MGGKQRRTAAGVILGVLVGTAGPMLGAVAFHSGSRSGNEPVSVTAAVAGPSQAEATWDGGYSITVSAAEDWFVHLDGNRQALSRARSGEVVARGSECDEFGSCTAATWTGRLSSAHSDGNLFLADPAATHAVFDGWLRREDNGRGCHFRVVWILTDDEPVIDGGSSGGGTTGSAEAEARASIMRSATATVDAACWRTDSNARDVSARLMWGLDAHAHASQAVDQTHLRDVCNALPPGTCSR